MQQALRIAQFLTIGYTTFGARGYRENARHFNPSSLNVDLTGRHVVLSGPTSGIGRATARALASRNATLHLLVRDEQRGQKIRDSIKSSSSSSSSEIFVHQCDISSLADIERIASHFEQEQIPVHVLINNAGIMRPKYIPSKDGLESAFATNTLGTFALTEMLQPALQRASPDARVITVSSGGMLTENLDVDDLEGKSITKKTGEINGPSQYSKCKRRQVAMTEYWARKYSDRNIFWASMHPGWADTPGLQTSMTQFYNFTKARLRTEEEGADTIVYLAAANEVKDMESGQFFFDRNPVDKHLKFGGTEYSERESDRLAERLREIIESKGFSLSS